MAKKNSGTIDFFTLKKGRVVKGPIESSISTLAEAKEFAGALLVTTPRIDEVRWVWDLEEWSATRAPHGMMELKHRSAIKE